MLSHNRTFSIVLMYVCFHFLSCQYEIFDDNNYIASLPEKILDNPASISLSTISSKSKYVIIDTSGGNYLGNIKFLRNAGSDYLVVDDREIIYVIDNTGRVKNKFQYIGNGPGEYLEIADIVVDPKSMEIYVRARNLKKLIKYNSYGDLLLERPFHDFYIDKLAFVDSNLIGISSFPSYLTYERSPEFVFIFDRNLNVIHAENHPKWGENKSKYIMNPLMGMSAFQLDDGLVFYEMYQNGHFYQIDTKNGWEIRKWLQIKIENNLSDHKIKEAKDFLSNPQVFNGKNYIEDVIVSKNYLFLTVAHGNMLEIKSVLYDVRHKSFTAVTDFAGYSRLWDDINGFFSFWPMGYLAYTQELYYFQDPGKMLQEFNEAITINSKSFQDADLKIIKLFEAAKKIGNPVIQLVKLNVE